MAWVTPPVFVSGNVLTAAQMNILSGDLNETPAAKATTGVQYFMSTAANTIAARNQTTTSVIAASTTSSVTYANLASGIGPTLPLTTGTSAIVFWGCKAFNSVGFGVCFSGIFCGGTTVVAVSDDQAIYTMSVNAGDYNRHVGFILYDGNLTPGVNNIFTLQYRVSGGTGTFDQRRLTVFPL